jgi:hypothetical protein
MSIGLFGIALDTATLLRRPAKCDKEEKESSANKPVCKSCSDLANHCRIYSYIHGNFARSGVRSN